jgi:hypothetical protein
VSESVIDRAGLARNNVGARHPPDGAKSLHAMARSSMNDFNRKVEDASSRVSKTIGDTAERLEKEIPEFIKYLNDEVVPAVRTHSTKALRTASQKLSEFADYMEKHHPPK